jgi:hypothetical protein
MKTFLSYSKQIFKAFLILIGVLIASFLTAEIFGQTFYLIMDPTTVFTTAIVGPYSFYSWFVVLAPFIGALLPSFFLAIWVMKDLKKLKISIDIKIRSYLWIIGVFLPTSIIVFPLYLIKKNIIWIKKFKIENSGSLAQNIPVHKYTSKKIIILIFIFIVITFFLFSTLILTSNRKFFKPVIDFIVENSLEDSCNGKSDCEEIRPLPKILQNKRIIFNDDTTVIFEPYHSSSIDFYNLDVLGSIDVERNYFFQDTVDPLSGEYGALLEREYKIVRAVYSYKCSYCFDSDDLGYIVLEDSKGNRFIDILDDSDPSVTPWKDIPWDEQLPYNLSLDKTLGTLVDI